MDKCKESINHTPLDQLYTTDIHHTDLAIDQKESIQKAILCSKIIKYNDSLIQAFITYIYNIMRYGDSWHSDGKSLEDYLNVIALENHSHRNNATNPPFNFNVNQTITLSSSLSSLNDTVLLSSTLMMLADQPLLQIDSYKDIYTILKSLLDKKLESFLFNQNYRLFMRKVVESIYNIQSDSNEYVYEVITLLSDYQVHSLFQTDYEKDSFRKNLMSLIKELQSKPAPDAVYLCKAILVIHKPVIIDAIKDAGEDPTKIVVVLVEKANLIKFNLLDQFEYLAWEVIMQPKVNDMLLLSNNAKSRYISLITNMIKRGKTITFTDPNVSATIMKLLSHQSFYDLFQEKAGDGDIRDFAIKLIKDSLYIDFVNQQDILVILESLSSKSLLKAVGDDNNIEALSIHINTLYEKNKNDITSRDVSKDELLGSIYQQTLSALYPFLEKTESHPYSYSLDDILLQCTLIKPSNVEHLTQLLLKLYSSYGSDKHSSLSKGLLLESLDNLLIQSLGMEYNSSDSITKVIQALHLLSSYGVFEDKNKTSETVKKVIERISNHGKSLIFSDISNTLCTLGYTSYFYSPDWVEKHGHSIELDEFVQSLVIQLVQHLSFEQQTTTLQQSKSQGGEDISLYDNVSPTSSKHDSGQQSKSQGGEDISLYDNVSPTSSKHDSGQQSKSQGGEDISLYDNVSPTSSKQRTSKILENYDSATHIMSALEGIGNIIENPHTNINKRTLQEIYNDLLAKLVKLSNNGLLSLNSPENFISLMKVILHKRVGDDSKKLLVEKAIMYGKHIRLNNQYDASQILALLGKLLSSPLCNQIEHNLRLNIPDLLNNFMSDAANRIEYSDLNSIEQSFKIYANHDLLKSYLREYSDLQLLQDKLSESLIKQSVVINPAEFYKLLHLVNEASHMSSISSVANRLLLMSKELSHDEPYKKYEVINALYHISKHSSNQENNLDRIALKTNLEENLSSILSQSENFNLYRDRGYNIIQTLNILSSLLSPNIQSLLPRGDSKVMKSYSDFVDQLIVSLGTKLQRLDGSQDHIFLEIAKYNIGEFCANSIKSDHSMFTEVKFLESTSYDLLNKMLGLTEGRNCDYLSVMESLIEHPEKIYVHTTADIKDTLWQKTIDVIDDSKSLSLLELMIKHEFFPVEHSYSPLLKKLRSLSERNIFHEELSYFLNTCSKFTLAAKNALEKKYPRISYNRTEVGQLIKGIQLLMPKVISKITDVDHFISVSKSRELFMSNMNEFVYREIKQNSNSFAVREITTLMNLLDDQGMLVVPPVSDSHLDSPELPKPYTKQESIEMKDLRSNRPSLTRLYTKQELIEMKDLRSNRPSYTRSSSNLPLFIPEDTSILASLRKIDHGFLSILNDFNNRISVPTSNILTYKQFYVDIINLNTENMLKDGIFLVSQKATDKFAIPKLVSYSALLAQKGKTRKAKYINAGIPHVSSSVTYVLTVYDLGKNIRAKNNNETYSQDNITFDISLLSIVGGQASLSTMANLGLIPVRVISYSNPISSIATTALFIHYEYININQRLDLVKPANPSFYEKISEGSRTFLGLHSSKDIERRLYEHSLKEGNGDRLNTQLGYMRELNVSLILSPIEYIKSYTSENCSITGFLSYHCTFEFDKHKYLRFTMKTKIYKVSYPETISISNNNQSLGETITNDVDHYYKISNKTLSDLKQKEEDVSILSHKTSLICSGTKECNTYHLEGFYGIYNASNPSGSLAIELQSSNAQVNLSEIEKNIYVAAYANGDKSIFTGRGNNEIIISRETDLYTHINIYGDPGLDSLKLENYMKNYNLHCEITSKEGKSIGTIDVAKSHIIFQNVESIYTRKDQVDIIKVHNQEVFTIDSGGGINGISRDVIILTGTTTVKETLVLSSYSVVRILTDQPIVFTINVGEVIIDLGPHNVQHTFNFQYQITDITNAKSINGDNALTFFVKSSNTSTHRVNIIGKSIYQSIFQFKGLKEIFGFTSSNQLVSMKRTKRSIRDVIASQATELSEIGVPISVINDNEFLSMGHPIIYIDPKLTNHIFLSKGKNLVSTSSIKGNYTCSSQNQKAEVEVYGLDQDRSVLLDFKSLEENQQGERKKNLRYTISHNNDDLEVDVSCIDSGDSAPSSYNYTLSSFRTLVSVQFKRAFVSGLYLKSIFIRKNELIHSINKELSLQVKPIQITETDNNTREIFLLDSAFIGEVEGIRVPIQIKNTNISHVEDNMVIHGMKNDSSHFPDIYFVLKDFHKHIHNKSIPFSLNIAFDNIRYILHGNPDGTIRENVLPYDDDKILDEKNIRVKRSIGVNNIPTSSANSISSPINDFITWARKSTANLFAPTGYLNEYTRRVAHDLCSKVENNLDEYKGKNVSKCEENIFNAAKSLTEPEEFMHFLIKEVENILEINNLCKKKYSSQGENVLQNVNHRKEYLNSCHEDTARDRKRVNDKVYSGLNNAKSWDIVLNIVDGNLMLADLFLRSLQKVKNEKIAGSKFEELSKYHKLYSDIVNRTKITTEITNLIKNNNNNNVTINIEKEDLYDPNLVFSFLFGTEKEISDDLLTFLKDFVNARELQEQEEYKIIKELTENKGFSSLIHPIVKKIMNESKNNEFIPKIDRISERFRKACGKIVRDILRVGISQDEIYDSYRLDFISLVTQGASAKEITNDLFKRVTLLAHNRPSEEKGWFAKIKFVLLAPLPTPGRIAEDNKLQEAFELLKSRVESIISEITINSENGHSKASNNDSHSNNSSENPYPFDLVKESSPLLPNITKLLPSPSFHQVSVEPVVNNTTIIR